MDSWSEKQWPEVDRRQQIDRRNKPTRWWDPFVGRRRRKQGRRKGETREVYVDVLDWRDLALVVAVFTLSILDAALTLVHIDAGGSEANPLMNLLLSVGRNTFLFEKCALVGLWLIILGVHRNFILARISLWLLLVFYTGLLGYHIALRVG